MKCFLLCGVLAAAAPAVALAQDEDGRSFHGFKIGANLTRSDMTAMLEVPTLAAPQKAKDDAWGYRGFVALDSQVVDGFVVGGELGLGKRGTAVEVERGANARSLDTGWGLDASARAGVTPVPGLLLYGRGGYSWLKTKDVRVAAGASERKRRRTEGGALYGAGLEVAVARNLFVRAEYSRTRYNDDLKASQTQVGLAVRF